MFNFSIRIATQVLNEFAPTAGTAVWRAGHTAAVRYNETVSVFSGEVEIAQISHTGNGQTEVKYTDGRTVNKKRRVPRTKTITAASEDAVVAEAATVVPNYQIKVTPTGKYMIQENDSGAWKFISKNDSKVQEYLSK